MTGRKRRAARLDAAIDWIALNDEPAEMNIEIVATQISVCLVADLWGREPIEIARMVLARRKRAARTLAPKATARTQMGRSAKAPAR